MALQFLVINYIKVLVKVLTTWTISSALLVWTWSPTQHFQFVAWLVKQWNLITFHFYISLIIPNYLATAWGLYNIMFSVTPIWGQHSWYHHTRRKTGRTDKNAPRDTFLSMQRIKPKESNFQSRLVEILLPTKDVPPYEQFIRRGSYCDNGVEMWRLKNLCRLERKFGT